MHLVPRPAMVQDAVSIAERLASHASLVIPLSVSRGASEGGSEGSLVVARVEDLDCSLQKLAVAEASLASQVRVHMPPRPSTRTH